MRSVFLRRATTDFDWTTNPSITLTAWWSRVSQKKSFYHWKAKALKVLASGDVNTDTTLVTALEQADGCKWKALVAMLARLDVNTFQVLKP